MAIRKSQNGVHPAEGVLEDLNDGPPNASTNGFTYALEDPTVEPIAVIGMSLKFPQEATSPEAFWDMLYEGRCAMTEFPPDRFNIDAFYDKENSGTGTLPLRGGHFLKEDLGAFDAPFFSVTPAEAVAMDPQQRIMLETSYHALENAGLTIDKCSGSKTSVYTATFTDDYKSMLQQDPEQLPKYAATGLSGSMLANRVSWFFNLRGPSMNLDSACSSSLSALHIACQDLLNGTSKMALVGGCNLVFHPDFMLIMSNMSFMSPDSRCWSFDHRANGYARGDGFGVVVLKKLSDALQDGDTIRAVIRATGLNQDGRTTGGITQPNGEAQQLLINETFTRANLDMAPVRFFEAHGTGTALGDPTEAKAIGNSFRSFRSAEEPLIVGAVKSNIGHLEGGSGIAGLIKTVMILEKGIILPNTGLEKVNPRIDTQNLRIHFPTRPMQWPSLGLRRACVNSFGFGGSNAVVIVDDALHFLKAHRLRGHHRTIDLCLQESIGETNGTKETNGFYEPVEQKSERDVRRVTDENGFSTQLTSTQKYPRPRLLIFSAADEIGIKSMLDTYGEFFKKRGRAVLAPSFDDIVHTLAAKRSLHAWRSYTVATSGSDLISLEKDSSKPIRFSGDPKSIAFVFTGQGAQYAKMGNGLLAFPLFKLRFAELDHILQGLGCEWSLQALLCDSASTINEPEYSQTFSTALQIAIVDLLKSFGITPAAVVGHSSGEIAAAYCAGAFDDRTAMKIAFHRGRLAARLPTLHEAPQAMLAVALGEERIQPFLAKLKENVEIFNVQVGCVNSPKSITLTGDKDQLEILESWLKDDQHLARKLRVNVAYHSSFMKAIKTDYYESLKDMNSKVAKKVTIPMISSVTGAVIPLDRVCDAEYWVKNLISQVKFSQAVSLLSVQSGKAPRKTLGSKYQSLSGIKELIEIGPHSTLQGPLQEILTSTKSQGRMSYLSILNRQRDAAACTLDAVGRLWSLGYPIDMLAVNGFDGKMRPVVTDLPSYPFNHTQKYWFEDRTSTQFRFRSHARHELLGSIIPSSSSFEVRWRNFLSLEKLQWVQHHQISNNCLLPGAAMLAMAIEGVKQLTTGEVKVVGFEMRDVQFLNALQVPDSNEGLEIQVSLATSEDRVVEHKPWYEFRLFSFSSEWSEHCRCRIRAETASQVGSIPSPISSYHQELSSIANACVHEADVKHFYDVTRDNGVNYGPIFQTLDHVRFNESGAAMAEIRAFSGSADDKSKGLNFNAYTIHPSVLDGLFQMVFPALNQGGALDLPTMVPSSIRKLVIYTNEDFISSGSHLRASVRSSFNGYRGTESKVIAVSPSNNELFSIMEGYQTTFVSTSNDTQLLNSAQRPLLSHLEWRPDLTLLNNEQISGLCKQARPQNNDFVNFQQRLSLLIQHYISRTLEALKQSPPEGISPHSLKYIRWMVQQHSQPDNDWAPRALSEATGVDSLENEIEAANNLGQYYVTLGRNLLPLLLDEGSKSLVSREELASTYFNEQLASQNIRKQVEVLLSNLAHKIPTMKILELGGSAGTSPCLSILSAKGNTRWLRYDYTNASSDKVLQAQEKLGSSSNRVYFQVLDIENEPTAQGIEDFSYDLIIAAHVLQMTSDLPRTFRNLRRLLKPGGNLILVGIAAPQSVNIDFIFGLIQGWWTNGQTSLNPYRSKEEVSKALTDSGFNGIDYSIQDFEDQEHHEIDVIVATAAEQVASEALELPEIAIVIDEKSLTQANFAYRLKEKIQGDGKTTALIHDFADAVSKRSINGMFCVFLLDYDEPFFPSISLDEFNNFKEVLSLTNDILWVARDTQTLRRPEFHMVDGLSRALRSENPKLRFARVTITDDGQTGLDGPAAVITVLNRAIQSPLDDMEPEYEERDGMLCINRVIQSERMNRLIGANIASYQERTLQLSHELPIRATMKNSGMTNSITYEEVAEWDDLPDPDEVLVQVRAVGLTSRDYQIASGQLNEESIFTECSGLIVKAGSDSGFSPGDKVFVSCSGVCTTSLRCKASSAALLPNSMSFIEAAALPTSALLSFQALVNAASLARDEVVLIHHAAGAIGQAAIQISQTIGAKIIVTTGSEEKAELLRSTYSLSRDSILSNKDPHLSQSILQATADHGVDVVLSFDLGDDLDVSLEVLAPFGRLVNFGIGNNAVSAKVTKQALPKCITYTSLNLAEIQRLRPQLIGKLFKQTSPLIRSGDIRPAMPLNVFQACDLVKGLQSFHTGRSVGKVVIDFDPEHSVTALVTNKPSYYFDPEATYLIAGGFGGLGRSVSRWMVDRGARNLIILARSGTRTESAKELVRELEALGARVEAPACDIIQAESLEGVLEQCAKTLPPIRGCLQCTMVLRDAIFDNMTHDDFTTGTQPKVIGSWNLHTLLLKGLDFFVSLSSIGGILGATSQANYCAGNTYIDALARYRTSVGEKAVSIDLGMMVSEGVVAETEGMLDSLRRLGYFMDIRQAEFLALLDHYCNPALPLLAPSESQIIVGIEHPASMEAKGLEVPHWMLRPLFRHFQLINKDTAGPSNKQKQSADSETVLRQSASAEVAVEHATGWIVSKLSQILGIKADEIEVQKPVHVNGINSLIAVELRNWFDKKLGADVTVFEILGNMSIVDLSKYTVDKSRFREEK